MSQDTHATFYSSKQWPAVICTLHVSSSQSYHHCQTLQTNTTTCGPTPPPPTIDEDVPMDTGGIDFEVLGDGPGDKPMAEAEAEPDEPITGVHCILKPKAKQYENSVGYDL